MVSLNNYGKFLGIRDGFKVFKNVVREEGSKVYNTNKTYYTYIDNANNPVKTIVRNSVSKSDIAKGRSITPRSSWTTTDLTNGNQEIMEYYPRSIRKGTHPAQGLSTQQSLILSQDGKFVERYDKIASNYQAGIAYGSPHGGRYHSKYPSESSDYEPKCEWTSLADYNKAHPYDSLK